MRDRSDDGSHLEGVFRRLVHHMGRSHRVFSPLTFNRFYHVLTIHVSYCYRFVVFQTAVSSLHRVVTSSMSPEMPGRRAGWNSQTKTAYRKFCIIPHNRIPCKSQVPFSDIPKLGTKKVEAFGYLGLQLQSVEFVLPLYTLNAKSKPEP